MTDANWEAARRGDRMNPPSYPAKETCRAVRAGDVWSCTRHVGHDGQHVSASYGVVHDTWTDDR